MDNNFLNIKKDIRCSKCGNYKHRLKYCNYLYKVGYNINNEKLDYIIVDIKDIEDNINMNRENIEKYNSNIKDLDIV